MRTRELAFAGGTFGMDFVRRLFSMYTLMVLVGYTLLILIGWLAAIVILKIQRDQIDLTYVLSENDGGASMSRFQLMIFTFVISLSFFLVIVLLGVPVYFAWKPKT